MITCKEGCRELSLSDLKPTKQYAVLHKGGSYSFQSDKPVGDDVVACFDLAHSEKPLSEDFFDENRQDDKQMKTYNTYQEAKIANPECEIAVKTKKAADDFGDAICFQAVVADSSWSDGYAFSDDEDSSPRISDGYWKICNPADHCMTVEEFLKDGHKFVEGDVYFHIKEAELSVVGVGGFEPGHANTLISDDAESYILRAAALDLAAIAKQNVEYYSKQISDTAREAFSTNSTPKLKRTKVEFVKVVGENFFGLESDLLAGNLYCGEGDEWKIIDIPSLADEWTNNNLYRRIETEIDERQEFIDAACSVIEDYHGERRQYVVEALYDSGKFKLVN